MVKTPKGGTGSGELPPGPGPDPAVDPTTFPLIQAADLTLVGSFRVPEKGAMDEQKPQYGGTGLCYWPAHDSLIMVGHDHHQWVTEFSIPTPAIAATVAELPRATERQAYVDLLQGKLYTVDGGTGDGVKIGGISPRGTDASLIVNVWTYYDNAQPPQMKTHFRVGQWGFASLIPDDVTGPYQVGEGFAACIPPTTPGHDHRIGGFVSGYMCVVPEAWRSRIGSERLTGQGGGVSVVNRTSSGPSCSAFDMNPDGVVDPVPAALLMGYPSHSSDHASPYHHPTLGDWGVDGSGLGLYNGTQYFRGMVFPDDTRSVLFVGWRGTSFCYGPGTADEAFHEVPLEPPQYDASGDPVHYCYDPTNDSKGTHGYPYEACIYAYDVNDLLAVKAGTTLPWEVVPYATWRLDYPFEQKFGSVLSAPYMTMGAAWDPAKRWLFVTGYRQDGDAPVVHVFQVA